MEPQNNLIEPTNKSHRILFTTLIVLLTAGVIGGSVYYVLGKQVKEQQKQIDELNKKAETKTETKVEEKKEEKKAETPVVQKDETADWKTYTDTTYGFSFKYPTTLAVTPSKSNNTVNYYMLSLNKVGVINPQGINTDPDSSGGYVSVSANATGGAPTSIAGLTANYSTATTPMGYTYYAYEFSKGGKYYLVRMNDYSDNKFITLDQFKTMVGTFKFN